MPPLTDPAILGLYRSALNNWNVTGYVDWNEISREWVRRSLPTFTLKDVAELMYKHVAAGGVVDQVPERRPEWKDREFHYDLRLPIAGRLRYIETVLVDEDPTDPIIYVVSIHDA